MVPHLLLGGAAVTEDYLVCPATLRTQHFNPEMAGIPPCNRNYLARKHLEARRATCIDSPGRFVPLEQQDRSRWDGAEIAEGLRLLPATPGPYQLQAAIAACHLCRPPAPTCCAGRAPTSARHRPTRKRSRSRRPMSSAHTCGRAWTKSSSEDFPGDVECRGASFVGGRPTDEGDGQC